jgi:hypothetical protein
MAIAKFKSKVFSDPQALYLFVSSDVTVASVISIVTDSSGKYVLFYLTP